MTNKITDSNLGQDTQYPEQYDPTLLFPIARAETRQGSPAEKTPAWIGGDIWTAFEVSWLDSKGKPIVAIASFEFPQTNHYLIESKSFKLYLNSFNQSEFDRVDEVATHFKQDLSKASGGTVNVEIKLSHEWNDCQVINIPGASVDELDVDIDTYEPNAALLQLKDGAGNDAEQVNILYSNLLKSKCPVTNQPDWGTVIIAYKGKTIDPAAFLKYIVSYRLHNGFHELCVEEIYCDLLTQCAPDKLFVMARYTRRGGLDINPWRASDEEIIESVKHLLMPFNRLARQ